MRPSYFLKRVAQRTLQLKVEHENVAVVFPNQRAGIYLKQHLGDMIDAPIFAPAILTLEELLNNVSGNIRLDAITQYIELFRAYQAVDMNQDGKDTFDQFLPWAATFIKDCNDIDNALVDPSDFFDQLYQDKKIRNWTLSEDSTQLQRDYLNFWKHAEQLYRAFTQRLSNLGGGYVGFNYRQAIQKIEAGAVIPYDYVLIAGFNALNKAEERALDLITADQHGEVMWDMDAYYADSDAEVQQAGKYYRKYKDRWKTIEELTSIMGYKNTEIILWESPNNTAQCDIVQQLINNKNENGEDFDSTSTAIILSDENLLEPLLLKLPENNTSYNITMGKPLVTFSLYHFFDKILNVYHEADREGFTAESLKNLAFTPSARILDDDNQFNKLNSTIIKSNIYRLSQKELKDEINHGFWHDLNRVDYQDITAIITFIEDCIHKLRFKAYERQDSQTVEVLYEFRNVFIQLKSLPADHPDLFTLTTMRRLYKQISSQTKIPFEGEPVTGIQIMGLLESRLLDFDHIILLSANEGSLPESKHSQSFIPFMFKKYYGMPTYDERDAIFAYSFYRLLHHPSKVDLLYNGSVGSGGNSEKSRYLQQLEAEYVNKVNYDVSLQNRSATLPIASLSYPVYLIERTESYVEEVLSYLKNKRLSATSIAMLVQSPLDFYLQYVKNYRDPDVHEAKLASNTYGSIIHNTLEDIYKLHIGEVLTEEILDDYLKNYESILIKKFSEEIRQSELKYGYNRLLYNAAKVMVEEAIKLDYKRIKKHDIKVLDVELVIETSLPFLFNNEKIDITLFGKIDRVQQRDHVIELIDYKSGSVYDLKSKNILEVAENFKLGKLQQLVTYAYMFEKSNDRNIDINHIKPAIQGLRSWQKGLTFIDNDENYTLTKEVLETFEKNVQNRLTEFLDTSSPLIPESDNNRLKYSNFTNIWNLA